MMFILCNFIIQLTNLLSMNIESIKLPSIVFNLYRIPPNEFIKVRLPFCKFSSTVKTKV